MMFLVPTRTADTIITWKIQTFACFAVHYSIKDAATACLLIRNMQNFATIAAQVC